MSAGFGAMIAVVSAALAQQPAPESTAAIRQELHQLKQESADIAVWTGRFLTEWGLRTAGVLLVLIGAWIVSSRARRAVYRAMNRPQFDQTLVRFLSNAARWAVLVVGLVASLTMFGIAPTTLAALVGAAGLAVGLAIQGSLSNLAAGIMLILLRPFNVGDTVIVAGQTGKVDDLELFHTKLDAGDNRRIIVPNGLIFGAVIENLTHHATRSATVNVTVSYAADLDKTRDALMAAATGVHGRLPDSSPGVSVQNLAPTGVEWQVVVWATTAEIGTVRQQLMGAVKRALENARVGFAVPAMELRRSEPVASDPSRDD